MIVAPLVVALAAGPYPDPAALVRRLGAPAYADREAAGKALRRLGPRAEAAARAGLLDPHPEVARRAAAVLGLIEADAHWRQIAGTPDRPTPAWRAFREAAGDTPEGRLLYTRVAAGGRYDRLAAAAADPAAAAKGYAAELARVRAGYEQVFPPGACGGLWLDRRAVAMAAAPPDDVALVLFLGALARPDGWTDPNRVGSLQDEGFADLVRGVDGPAARGLFAAWLDRRRSPEALSDGLYTALRLAVREALPAARRVLADPTAEARPVGYALLVLGNHGTPEDRPLLAGFRTDARVHHQWSGGGEVYTIQLRDVAATMLLFAAGEDPKTHGFEWVRRGPNPGAPEAEAYREGGWFPAAAAREAAHKKAWGWLDAQPPAKK